MIEECDEHRIIRIGGQKWQKTDQKKAISKFDYKISETVIKKIQIIHPNDVRKVSAVVCVCVCVVKSMVQNTIDRSVWCRNIILWIFIGQNEEERENFFKIKENIEAHLYIVNDIFKNEFYWIALDWIGCLCRAHSLNGAWQGIYISTCVHLALAHIKGRKG